MQRILTTTDQSQVEPPRVLTLAAATATVIFPMAAGLRGPEIVSRYVQNLTGADLYLSFGIGTDNAPVCNNTNNFHAVITDKQLYDCMGHRRIVCAYSVGGGVVATTQLTRV